MPSRWCVNIIHIYMFCIVVTAIGSELYIPSENLFSFVCATVPIMRNSFIWSASVILLLQTWQTFKIRPRPWIIYWIWYQSTRSRLWWWPIDHIFFFPKIEQDHLFSFSHLYGRPQGVRHINNCAPLPHIYALETKKHQIYITAPMRCNGRLVSKVMPHETANIQPTVWRDESTMVQDPKISEDLQPAQTECRISLDSIVNIINQY